MNQDDPSPHDPPPQNQTPQVVLNITGFIVGGASLIVVPVLCVLVPLLAQVTVALFLPLLLWMAWQWSGWPRAIKEFLIMALLGIVVGLGFLAVAYFNMREQNSGWFQ